VTDADDGDALRPGVGTVVKQGPEFAEASTSVSANPTARVVSLQVEIGATTVAVSLDAEAAEQLGERLSTEAEALHALDLEQH
jgi:hypothetical protein